MKYILAIFILISSQPGKAQEKQLADKANSLFISIDARLDSFAKSVNGIIIRDKGGHNINGVEMKWPGSRSISWVGGLTKGILITPCFDMNGFNGKWDFSVVAANEQARFTSPNTDIPFWEKKLLSNVTMAEIETDIDKLLMDAREILDKFEVKDLK